MDKKKIIKYAGAALSLIGLVCSWLGDQASEKRNQEEMREEMRKEVQKEVARQIGTRV